MKGKTDKKKFRIIEGDSNYGDKIYEEFKIDFLNPKCTVGEIKKKYKLGKGQYNHLRLQVLNETGLQEKPSIRGGRHLTITDKRYLVEYKNGSYAIYKTKTKVKQYYGTYPNLETACYVRDRLVECDWDKKISKQLKEKYSLKKRN